MRFMVFLSFVFWPDYTLQMAASDFDFEATYFQIWYNTAAQVLIGQFQTRLSINYSTLQLKIIIVNDVLEP
jgi:hypothetical protein